MQNGYHHTPNKGTPHCDGEHGAEEKEEGKSGHCNDNNDDSDNHNNNNDDNCNDVVDWDFTIKIMIIRWIRTSQAKKIWRIFTRDLHH